MAGRTSPSAGTDARARLPADGGSPPLDPALDREPAPDSVARTIALGMLARRPCTRAELATALSRRGVPADAAANVLDRLTEVGLIDDAAFAAAWVDSRHSGRGLARRALATELRRRGVDEQSVREAVAEVSDDDEAATARALVARRLPSLAGLTAEVQGRRLVGLLGRRGFSRGLAVRVVREALSAAEGE